MLFVYQQGKELSLSDLCLDLYQSCGVEVRKQSIQERFTEKAVAFMKAVLGEVLRQEVQNTDTCLLKHFKRVRIKDSTRFALPDSFSRVYKGHGGATNTVSMISIQYEYDLLSSQTMDLKLTSGTRNDQQDSKESTSEIKKGDLFIRDLGYVTLGYLQQIIDNGAYFLNRLAPQTAVYHADAPTKVLDFKACHHYMKKHNIPFMEYDVLIGKKKKIPVRLIMHMTAKGEYEKRLRKTKKQARSYGHQVSEAYKDRTRLTLFITNVEKEKITTAAVKQIYRLRWQIELTFKIWKSQAKISQVKEMKMYRFECQLLAKLIWLMLHWKMFRYLCDYINSITPNQSASIWKYYKYAFLIDSQVRKAIERPNELKEVILNLKERAIPYFILEKKYKTTQYETLMLLT